MQVFYKIFKIVNKLMWIRCGVLLGFQKIKAADRGRKSVVFSQFFCYLKYLY